MSSRLWIVLLIVFCVAKIGSTTTGTGVKKCKREMRTLLNTCTSRNKRNPIMGALNPSIRVQRDVARRKRQIMSIREIVLSPRVPLYDIPYPSVSSYVGYETTPIVPPTETNVHRTPRRFESLPGESHSHVGFDADIDELTELIHELFQRMPRSTDKKKQATLMLECCLGKKTSCGCT